MGVRWTERGESYGSISAGCTDEKTLRRFALGFRTESDGAGEEVRFAGLGDRTEVPAAARSLLYCLYFDANAFSVRCDLRYELDSNTDVRMLFYVLSTSFAPIVGCSKILLPFFELHTKHLCLLLRVLRSGSL